MELFGRFEELEDVRIEKRPLVHLEDQRRGVFLPDLNSPELLSSISRALAKLFNCSEGTQANGLGKLTETEEDIRAFQKFSLLGFFSHLMKSIDFTTSIISADMTCCVTGDRITYTKPFPSQILVYKKTPSPPYPKK